MNLALPRPQSFPSWLRRVARRWNGPGRVERASRSGPNGHARPVRAGGHETCPSTNNAAAEAVSRQNFPGSAPSPTPVA